MNKERVLFLFDVDGTLTPSREKVTQGMLDFLTRLKSHGKIGFVGGSDIAKQKEQLGDDCTALFDYCFPENGLHYIKNGKQVSSQSYIESVGEAEHCRLVNKVMELMSKIDLPKKRGNFIELRTSMVNISPVGRSCSREERKEFCEYDKANGIREKIVAELQREFTSLSFSIGGEISIDIFPKGWDKTYCLQHIKDENIDRVFFFGDMTHEGGNDHEIYKHPETTAYTVASPEDTMVQVEKVMKEHGMV